MAFKVGDKVCMAPNTNVWAQYYDLRDKIGEVTELVNDGTPMERVTVSYFGEPVLIGVVSDLVMLAPSAVEFSGRERFWEKVSKGNEHFFKAELNGETVATVGRDVQDGNWRWELLGSLRFEGELAFMGWSTSAETAAAAAEIAMAAAIERRG